MTNDLLNPDIALNFLTGDSVEDIQKSESDIALDMLLDIEKAMGKKDLSKLHKKEITNKKGFKTFVWVKNEQDVPAEKRNRATDKEAPQHSAGKGATTETGNEQKRVVIQNPIKQDGEPKRPVITQPKQPQKPVQNETKKEVHVGVGLLREGAEAVSEKGVKFKIKAPIKIKFVKQEGDFLIFGSEKNGYYKVDKWDVDNFKKQKGSTNSAKPASTKEKPKETPKPKEEAQKPKDDNTSQKRPIGQGTVSLGTEVTSQDGKKFKLKTNKFLNFHKQDGHSLHFESNGQIFKVETKDVKDFAPEGQGDGQEKEEEYVKPKDEKQSTTKKSNIKPGEEGKARRTLKNSADVKISGNEKKVAEGQEKAPKNDTQSDTAKSEKNKELGKQIVDILKTKIKNFTDKEKKFFESGEHAADSKTRKTFGEFIRKKTRGIIKVIKHELGEFKHAGIGIYKLINGKPLGAEEKKAMKSVAKELAMVVGSMVLTGGLGHLMHGVGSASAAITSHYVQHMGMSAVGKSLLFAKAEDDEEDHSNMNESEARHYVEGLIEGLSDYIESGDISEEEWIEIMEESGELNKNLGLDKHIKENQKTMKAKETEQDEKKHQKRKELLDANGGENNEASNIEKAEDDKDFVYKKYMDKSLGYKRENMPQLEPNDIDSFLIHFAGKNVKVKKIKRKLKDLKPTQDDINDYKILKMIKDKSDWKARKYIISLDSYMLDAHHNWAQGLEYDPEEEVECYRVNLPIKKLVHRTNKLKITKNKDINDKEIKKSMDFIFISDNDIEKADLDKSKLHKITKVTKSGKKNSYWVSNEVAKPVEKKNYVSETETKEEGDEIIKRANSIVANAKSPEWLKNRAKQSIEVEKEKWTKKLANDIIKKMPKLKQKNVDNAMEEIDKKDLPSTVENEKLLHKYNSGEIFNKEEREKARKRLENAGLLKKKLSDIEYQTKRANSRFSLEQTKSLEENDWEKIDNSTLSGMVNKLEEVEKKYSKGENDSIQKAKLTKEQEDKVSGVMEEFSNGKLKSSGKVVTDKKQALAIAYSYFKGDKIVKAELNKGIFKRNFEEFLVANLETLQDIMKGKHIELVTVRGKTKTFQRKQEVGSNAVEPVKKEKTTKTEEVVNHHGKGVKKPTGPRKPQWFDDIAKKYPLNRLPVGVPQHEVEVYEGEDKDNHWVMRWFDKKQGRKQCAYTREFLRKNANNKWAKIKNIKSSQIDLVRKQSEKMVVNGKDDKKKQAAAIIHIISMTGLRPGDRTLYKRTKNRGTSTLAPENLTITGSKVHFNFTGKSYQENNAEIDNKELADYLKKLQKEKEGQEFLFDVSKKEIVDTFHDDMGFKGLKLKDMRTYIATDMGRRMLLEDKQPPPPLPAKGVKKLIQEKLKNVYEKISQKLNNTPAMVKGAYLHPAVAEEWLVSLHLKPEEFLKAESAELKKKDKMLDDVIAKIGDRYGKKTYKLNVSEEDGEDEELDITYELPTWWDNSL